MFSWKKILVGAGIGGGLFFGGRYLLRLKRTGKELETVTTVKVHSLDLKGLTLRVDAILKNPTKTEIKIKFPFVKLYHRDELIGSSEVVNKDITLPSFGQAEINKIMILIPLTGLLSVGATLIQSLKNKEAVKLKIVMVTTIDLGVSQVPFEKSQEVTLKK